MSSTNRGATADHLGRYYTPAPLARAVLREWPGWRPGMKILEPHVGGGAWARAADSELRRRGIGGRLEVMDRDVFAPGLVDVPSICTHRQIGDFLRTTPQIGRPHLVVGNPPYSVSPEEAMRSLPHLDINPSRSKPVSVAEYHVRRALQVVGHDYGHVVQLLRDGFLGSDERSGFFKRFPIRHIYHLVPRPSFTGGGNDSCDYVVCWWDREHIKAGGSTTWSRLRWA